MKLQIKDISAVYINPDRFLDRKNKMEGWVKKIGFKSISRVAFNTTYPDRAITMNYAHLNALRSLLDMSQRPPDTNASIPAILFEDDAAPMQPLPEYFDVPEEADLVYLGGSNYDLLGIKLEEYNEDFCRVYNMLSFHAVLFPNKSSVKKIIKLLEKAINEKKFNDITIASSSTENIFLVPKEGNYFFQDDYTSEVTKFYWKDVLNKFLK